LSLLQFSPLPAVEFRLSFGCDFSFPIPSEETHEVAENYYDRHPRHAAHEVPQATKGDDSVAWIGKVK
jgi:hypothetical protein